jgi:SAM-dependent methyltransferase
MYGWNLRRLNPGFTLDIGCGVGRNLRHLDGVGVGIDHNRHSVAYARGQGLDAYTTDGFKQSEQNRPGRFDSILLSHVAEHMTYGEYVSLLREYSPLLRAGGRILVFCPQEAGFKSDASHVEFMDFPKLRKAAAEAGFRTVKSYSFPLPRAAGRWFKYNEFVSVSRKLEASS